MGKTIHCQVLPQFCNGFTWNLVQMFFLWFRCARHIFLTVGKVHCHDNSIHILGGYKALLCEARILITFSHIPSCLEFFFCILITFNWGIVFKTMALLIWNKLWILSTRDYACMVANYQVKFAREYYTL